MDGQTQQEFLHAVKAALRLTWDDLAERAGLKPRALKTYRMPVTSKDYRKMNGLAREAIANLLEERRSHDQAGHRPQPSPDEAGKVQAARRALREPETSAS